MQDKIKTQADRQLIKKILGFDPVDWARYTDGTLVVINPVGKKFKFSIKMIDLLKVEKSTAKKAAAKKTKKESLPKPEPTSNVAPGAAAK